ncbi:MAG: hypothetical protein HZB65_03390 [Candidatus Aenigmarchaeota archaeon]|nr:hypothetical protein [Candidatus Aenigmarchaeota archaeon]
MGGAYRIEDVVLSPRDELVIEYSGYNPFLICTFARNMLRDVLKISGSSLREDDRRWDFSDPNSRWFYGVWRGVKEEDNWTKSWFRIAAEGKFNVKDNTGSVKIQLRAHMFTTFEYGNPMTASLWKFFNYIFYNRQRRKYLEFHRDLVHLMKEQILKAYKIYQE